jgi:hypothetical protein
LDLITYEHSSDNQSIGAVNKKSITDLCRDDKKEKFFQINSEDKQNSYFAIPLGKVN